MFLSVVRFHSKYIQCTVYSSQAASRGGEEECFTHILETNLMEL